MKIKFADIPINVMDGIDRYPNTSICLTGYLLGFLTASLLSADFKLVLYGLGGGIVALVVAYFVGRES